MWTDGYEYEKHGPEMTHRMWLVVLASAPAKLRRVDWFAELGPIPHELEKDDYVAMVAWPNSHGLPPLLAATVAVSKLSRETATLRLRHRVSAIAGHEVTVAELGARLAVARGWTRERRADLIGRLRMITNTDFELIENALLSVALHYGPPAQRPAHRRPRTPGRRVLIAGRAANPRGSWR